MPRARQYVCGESCQGPPVRRFHPLRRLEGSAAYVIFLNNIFGPVEFLQKGRIPFVFEVYPGGCRQISSPAGAPTVPTDVKGGGLFASLSRIPCTRSR